MSFIPFEYVKVYIRKGNTQKVKKINKNHKWPQYKENKNQEKQMQKVFRQAFKNTSSLPWIWI